MIGAMVTSPQQVRGARGNPPIERQHVEAVLAQHGYRLTAPRAAVVETILRHERPFTAEQLVAELTEAHASIGRATVYRTLEILAAVDVLTRLIQADGRPAYLLGLPGHRHHLVCSACGAAVAFTRCPVDQLVSELTRDTDFAIHDHLLEVFGVCPTCQEASTATTTARAG
jgi:Fur family transcriptional regulator, ferric uptake regulator